MWRFPSDEYLSENGLMTPLDIFFKTPLKWVVLGFLTFCLFVYLYFVKINGNEDFDTFFERFYLDSTFQLKSVQFPPKRTLANKKITYSTLQNWQELADYDLIVDSRGNSKESLKMDYISKDSVSVIFRLDIDKIHANVIHKFIKKNNNWFLVEIEDKSEGINNF